MENDVEKKIALAKALSELPERPGLIPIPYFLAHDPFVKIPIQVSRYIEKLGGTIELEEDGRIRLDNYISLLKDYNLHHLQIVPMTGFVQYSAEEIEAVKVRNGRRE